jgi:SAM-dependent methyltransferase
MSESTSPTPANDGQTRFWSGDAGTTWVDLQTLMDRQLGPLGEAAMDALLLQPGQHVMDVGCGCGTTTIELARRVHPDGLAVGVDISAPMIGVARSHNAAGTSFILADPQLDVVQNARPFDAVYSRFGVMFFDDPIKAFTNIRGFCAPQAQLSFVCWQSPSLNEWASGVGGLVNQVLGPMPPTDPRAPGPFAFADPEYVFEILEASGWSDIALSDEHIPIQVFGTADLDTCVDAAFRVGISRRLTAEAATESQRNAVTALVRSYLAERMTADGWISDGAVWLVTASA